MGMGGAFWAIVGEHSICSRRILRRRPLPRADIESAPTTGNGRYKATVDIVGTVDTVDIVGHANRFLAYPPLPPPEAICSLAIYHTVNFYIINGCN